MNPRPTPRPTPQPAASHAKCAPERPRIAYVLPTRDRPAVLGATIDALAALPAHAAQVIVVDNASATRPDLPRTLANGLSVEVVRLRNNAGAAARNAGVMASDPACRWIVMLDDDSAPTTTGHLGALDDADARVAAVQAEIWLGEDAGVVDRGPHESGGLPEVFIGCGVAIRREVFLDLGGYDASFGYYAEEYDLTARMLIAGGRVTMDRRFSVVHRKVTAGRDMGVILGRLVRNNGWVMQRYAPERRRRGELAHIIDRYRGIAAKERADAGYRAGLAELMTTMRAQPRSPMATHLWKRFTGEAAAMASLERAWVRRGFRTAAVVEPGKNANVIRRALAALGVREVSDERLAEAVVIGTLSPGPMLDGLRRWRGDPRAVCAWDAIADLPGAASSRAA